MSGAVGGLTGTARLTRLALRRDRVVLPAWILGIGLFVAATTGLFNDSLAARADLVRETRLVATNAGMRMLGITSGPSIGGYMLHREFVTLGVLAALLGVLAVVRHTRQNEELGRAENLGATVVGRYAGLAAAVIVAVAAEVALAMVLGAAVALTGQPVAGSFLAGASVGAVGLVFVGVAAVTTQLASTSRGATGIAAAALGGAFVLSGIGNMLGSVVDQGLRVVSAWPAWLSPMGWGQQTRPFGAARWWPLLPCLVTLGVLVAVAVVLAGRRDVGRGLWPERRGRARGGSLLSSPEGLVWRLQRGLFTGWAVGLVGFGLIFGTLTEQIRHIQGPAAKFYTATGGTTVVVDAYRASMIQFAGVFVGIYVVQVLLRLRGEEGSGTAEPVLATGTGRLRWTFAHALNATAGAAALLVAFSLSMGLTAGGVLGNTPHQVRQLVGAGLVQLPGVLVLGAAVLVVVGVVPRWSVPIAWTLVVADLVVGPMFGPGLGLPQWVRDLSPYTHLPTVPATDFRVAPVVALLVAAALLGVLGLLAVRRRDLVLPA